MHKKTMLTTLLALALLTSLFQAVPVVMAAEDAADDGGEEANIYEWLNTSFYGGVGQWERYDPEGEAHKFNTDPANALYVPDFAKNQSYPYGAVVHVRNTGLIHEWWNPENYSWVIYDPEGGSVHPDNLEPNAPEYAASWSHPWWATTQTRERSAPDEGSSTDPGVDPVGALIEGYLSVADIWIESGWNFLMNIIGREDMIGDAFSLTDAYNEYVGPDNQP